MITNEVAQVTTNAIEIVTSSRITPQAVAYDFKQWAGVISMICASIYSAVHLVVPRAQAFFDTREGGWLQWMFYGMFGKPKSISQDKPEDKKQENKTV